MSFLSFLKTKDCKKSNMTSATKRRRKSAGINKLSFEKLEPKHLLAGIFFESATGEITVSGDGQNNVGQIRAVNSSTVRVSLNGYADQDFQRSDVNRVIFIGFGGDDTFTNNTGIEGLLLGSAGNDTLTGGSGFDQINGGAGDDHISGNAGNDRLIGSAGNDTIFGGGGDDSMFAGDGTNTMSGGVGNDTMFGGNQVDTLNGNDGIDQIFGLAGNDIINVGNGGIAGTTGIGQADLALGLDGDDEISGGTGLNVFYGGNGNDEFAGGSGENRMHGQNGNDILNGGTGNDFLAGNLDNDTINGRGGNDFILPGFGNDTVNGGGGSDFVVYTGVASDYTITGTVGDLITIDNRGIEGTDSVRLAERFRFNDGDQNAAPTITEVVTIQPIIVSNSNGTNTAEFFGNATQEADIKERVNEIYFQAGIQVDFLPARNWNNTFANVGNSAVRPTGDLDTIVTNGDSAGQGNSDPLVLDVYFVERTPGFGDAGENTTNGLAFVDASGVTMAVGDNLVGFPGGRAVVASVFAHEVGHNLGLDHFPGSNNLMSSSGNSNNLTDEQINTVINSSFTIPV